MSDMKPCPICDASMIKHCPNEKVALKYCGKSMMGELSRLRAELAAEKERAAGIAENFRESWPYGRLIAAAIRASNAAPRVGKIAPKEAILAQLDDKVDWALNYLKGVLSALPNDFGAKNAIEAIELLIEQNEEYAEELGTLRSNAAPPHVEPSAAESDVEWETRIANAAESAAGIDLIPRQSTSAYTLHRQAEARMLELAREMDDAGFTLDWLNAAAELRALVIETFGEKKW